MRKNKRQKKFLLLSGFLLAFISFFVFFNFVSADTKLETTKFGLDATKKSAGINISNDMTNIEGATAKILSISLSFLSVVFFLLVVYGGARWMLARGNSEEIAKAQETVIMAIIGVVIILGANALVNFVFTTIGTGPGQTSSSGTQTCATAHPGWEVLPFGLCAGENYTGIDSINVCNYIEGDETSVGYKNNCDINISDEKIENEVCCLPYSSKCSRTYPGYECQFSEFDCNVGTAKKQIGLCDDTQDDGNYCCLSSIVWCLVVDGDSFTCEEGLGQCLNSEGKPQEDLTFTDIEACRQFGEINAAL